MIMLKENLMLRKKDIAKFLKGNPNNYWVNTEGFKAIFK